MTKKRILGCLRVPPVEYHCFRLLTNSVAQEPESSSLHSQQPATGHYPGPVESNPPPQPISLRCTKSHVNFPVLRLCQRIRPSPRLYVVFRNKH
jgi:hypothetical protein